MLFKKIIAQFRLKQQNNIMSYKLHINLQNIQLQAKAFLEYIRTNEPETNCIAFYGKMGVGKTTFIKALCKEFKVIDTVTSPTFAIINEYRTETDNEIYHFDFYRIEKLTEVFDFGYEEYFYSTNYCLIEWPELIEELLPEKFIKVTIQEIDENKRVLEIKK